MSERFYSRLNDRSLQAYKDWILGVVKRVNPNAQDTMTEEEWVKAWKTYWEKVDNNPAEKDETREE